MALKTDTTVENLDLDLAFLEIIVEGEGGTVEFSVKELLVDIRKSIGDLGRTTKEDLAAAERRIHDRIVLVENAAKERAEANAERIAILEGDSITNQIKWARVAGIAGLGSVFGGAVVAAIAQALLG